tara:strand:- start:87 stop:332 length:246 start_codon:yes stop_codon:yes gene_type:complete
VASAAETRLPVLAPRAIKPFLEVYAAYKEDTNIKCIAFPWIKESKSLLWKITIHQSAIDSIELMKIVAGCKAYNHVMMAIL